MSGKLLIFCLFGVVLNLFFAGEAYCLNHDVKKELKPGWVTENKPDAKINSPAGSISGGYYYLLVDVQENLTTETTYYHYSFKLLNNEGVQNMSDISIDFDPSFQTLSFHELNRYRDGVKLNELQNHKIKVIQRESDMERFLYDGRLTAYVNLEDTREGDIIEYSYSIHGYNPIYKGNYAKTFALEFSDPVNKIYRRIISPKNKQLFFRYPAGQIEPVTKETGNTVEYIWQNNTVKGFVYDNNVPSWYNRSLRVEISTFRNWSDVVKLCGDNYAVTDSEKAKLKKLSESQFKSTDRDSLLISVIRFVQDKVRYLAFESGLSAYKPIPPGRVLESRYGDCKAKSLLLCSLLKQYGFEGYPVLVNSGMIRNPASHLPSFETFNHCIVQLQYNDKVYYIDPTLSNQGGEINNYYFPDYGYGLVLKDGVNDLVALSNNAASITKVNNYFKVSKIGGPVSYKVVTEYSGFYADDQRTAFQNKSSEETTKSYLKFYSKTYPLIRSVSPLKFKDDRKKNLLVVEEEYVIDSLWMPTKENPKVLTMEVAPLVINTAVSTPSSPARKMPYFISFPSDYREEIYIKLPVVWSVSPRKIDLEDSVFRYSYNSTYRDSQIHLQYSYTTLRDFLPAGSYSSYYNLQKQVTDKLYYQLSYNTAVKQPFRFSWISGLCCLLILTAGSYFAIKIYRNYNPKINNTGNQEIGGWLILIAIGLFLSTIKISYQFFFGTKFFDQVIVDSFMKKGLGNIPFLLLLIFEFIYNSALIVYLILIQILFYKRRSNLPRLIIIFYAANLSFLVFDSILAFNFSPESFSDVQKNKSYLQIFQNLIVSVVWITYFLNSKRVKATFTRILESEKHGIPEVIPVSEPVIINQQNEG